MDDKSNPVENENTFWNYFLIVVLIIIIWCVFFKNTECFTGLFSYSNPMPKINHGQKELSQENKDKAIKIIKKINQIDKALGDNQANNYHNLLSDNNEQNIISNLQNHQKSFDLNSNDSNNSNNSNNLNEKTCNFAHKGDYINKIGITARCPKLPDFGNPSSLTDDLYDMNIQDMKSILLYGINDSFLMSIWLDYNIKYKKINKHNMIILDNLDKVI